MSEGKSGKRNQVEKRPASGTAGAAVRAPRLRLARPWPGDVPHSTESRLAAIGRALPEHAAFLAGVNDALDPNVARRRRIERRDAAIREAGRLISGRSRHATAEELDRQLRRYLASAWPRERALDTAPCESSPLRAALWRIARETDGDGLRERAIFDILDE